MFIDLFSYFLVNSIVCMNTLNLFKFLQRSICSMSVGPTFICITDCVLSFCLYLNLSLTVKLHLGPSKVYWIKLPKNTPSHKSTLPFLLDPKEIVPRNALSCLMINKIIVRAIFWFLNVLVMFNSLLL